VQLLLKLGEDSDNRSVHDGPVVPAEIARREQRLAALGQAKAKILERAAERHAVQTQAHDAKSGGGLEQSYNALQVQMQLACTQKRGSVPPHLRVTISSSLAAGGPHE
jgi:hypothetical protein